MPDPEAGRIRALIVDDEPLAVDNVRIALAAFPDVEVVGECGSGRAAVEAITRARPDLVFLDVQMPSLDGFGVIEEVGPDAMPHVIFVTAYDEHALRAFEVNAVDYLLKPFDDERFEACVLHALARVRAARSGEAGQTLSRVLDSLPTAMDTRPGEEGSPHAERILVREGERMRFLHTRDLDWLEAAGNYVRLHAGKERHLIRATLTELSSRLDPRRFVRIHRSTIVNVDRIHEIQPWAGGDYVAVLQDGQQLRVSRTYRDHLLKPYA